MLAFTATMVRHTAVNNPSATACKIFFQGFQPLLYAGYLIHGPIMIMMRKKRARKEPPLRFICFTSDPPDPAALFRRCPVCRVETFRSGVTTGLAISYMWQAKAGELL